MKKKVITVIEWISGIASLLLLALNAYFVAEFIRLYTEVVADDMSSQLGNGLGKGIVLVLLIIFMAIMAAAALPRWIIYTSRSVKLRGLIKAILLQLPFFVVFTALFAWLYTLATDNVEIGGYIISTLLGGEGLTLIFADVDLYKKIFCQKKTTLEEANENNENN